LFIRSDQQFRQFYKHWPRTAMQSSRQ